ncbi:MAG: gamma-glutamyltransferase [Thermoleophilaceae bacterium]
MGAALAAWVAERGGSLSRSRPRRLPGGEPRAGPGALPRPRDPHQPSALLGRHPRHLRARSARDGSIARVIVEVLVEVMESAGRARTADFAAGLYADGYLEQLHGRRGARARYGRGVRPARARGRAAGASAGTPLHSRLGSTTHISVLDGEGACVSVTCSNGSSSGVVVPGTGVHLNNMLGEQDLNPLGFGRQQAGRRVSSMMAPTVVLRDGVPEAAIGSAGSNRIRSAILQTILAVGRRGPARRGRRRAPPPPRRGRRGGGRAGRRPGSARRPRAPRPRGAALARAQPLLRRRAGGGARPARRGPCRAVATRGGAARRWWCDGRTASTQTSTVAAVLSTREVERLYSGLSVLVSTASEGRPAAALAAFGALDLLLDPDLLRRAQEPEATPSLSWAGRERFASSLRRAA